MYPAEKTEIRVSPSAVAVLVLFVLLSSPVILAALLLAALAHEWGHYLVLRLLGGRVSEISITALGAEMHIAPHSRLSYGGEILATFAGPFTNLLFGLLLGLAGQRMPICYLLGGAQVILGAFNLLPITPLDGGSILWLAVAWLTQPDTADRITATVGLVVSVLLLAVTALLGCHMGGGGFLVCMALWLLLTSLRQRLRLT